MQRYINNIQNRNGYAVKGASVTVTTLAGALATIYSDNGATVQANPIITERDGEYSFYAADGRYNLAISAPGFVGEQISDFSLADPLTLVGTAAGNAGAAAQVILDEFRDIYYGPRSSDPTTKPSGAAMAVGDEYFYTGGIPKLLKRWNGSTWQASDISTANLAASGGSSLVGHLPAGTGAVARAVQDKLRESVSVKDFGAKGDGSTDDTLAIQRAIDYVKAQVFSFKLSVLFPGGRYLITATLNLGDNISLVGEKRDIGYLTGFSHSSEIIASGSMAAMVDVTGSNVYIGDLGFYGNNATDYCLYSAGVYGRASSNTFDNLAITLCKKSGIYLNKIGITKMSRLQISGCVESGIDGSAWGDADLDSLYINTINPDSTSTVIQPSTATVLGVGIRLRGDPQCGNINIRGGKIEFCRIGILINNGQGVNISGVNFDTCRRASILGYADGMTAFPNVTNANTYAVSSLQITGCRFLGGLMDASQSPSSHIELRYVRYATITGNGFKRGNDTAIDFGGFGGAQGPSYGIYLWNSELCTVTGNDLYGAAITNCMRIEHVTPANAQHTVFSNNMDGTEVFNIGMIKTQPVYGSLNFSSNSTPNAKNTAKAWVRFNGSGASPTIIASFGVAGVSGAGGTYTVTGLENWGVNAAIQVNARNWFGPSDNAIYGAVTSNTVIVYSTTAGALSSNGDITAVVFSA